MRILETKVYEFLELSKESKQKALDKQIEYLQQDEELSSFIKDDMTFYAKAEYDIDLEDLDLEFSLSNCQGDGVAFYGNLSSKNMLKIILKHRNKDMDLFDWEVIDLLERFPEIRLDITRNVNGNHYSHQHTMNVCLDMEDMESYTYELLEKLQEYTTSLEESFSSLVKVMSLDFANNGYESSEAYCSESNAKEMIDANEYEFYEDGSIV